MPKDSPMAIRMANAMAKVKPMVILRAINSG
jgi:hypothetical protein